MTVIRTHLLDTSVLIKLVVYEDKSDVVRKYVNSHSVFWTTSFCIAEAFGVLKATHSRYKKNCCNSSAQEGISESVYLTALEDLVSMVRDETISIEEANIFNREIFDEVEQLCSKYRLDAIDTFQLVTILRGFPSIMDEESSTILITADKKLARAARQENLKAWYCMKESDPT